MADIKYRLLEIEAWAYEDGWNWNNAFEIKTIEVPAEIWDYLDENLINYLRGILSEMGYPEDRMSVETYGECDFEFQNPDTQEPLLAFQRVYD